MTTGTASRVVARGGVVFHLERGQWTGPGRLEVAGHWSGVRGHRFFRPTLDVPGRRPVNALLDHKPWSPDEPEWVAAFSFDGELSEATLTVSPGIVVPLPTTETSGSPQPVARAETPPPEAPQQRATPRRNPTGTDDLARRLVS